MKILTAVRGGRYRDLILSIAVFFTLIIGLLAFTFYTSSLLVRNMALINETNRVANSAQSVIKDLFDLESSLDDINSPYMQAVLERLKQDSQIISDRLVVLDKGGVIIDESGKQIKISAIKTEEIKQAQAQWSLLEPKVSKYLANATNPQVDSSNDLMQAIYQARSSSLLIHDSLADLTANTAKRADTQATIVHNIQILGVVGVLAYFVFFIAIFIRRLQTSDGQLEIARRQTSDILNTVTEGLFLIDKELVISGEYSHSLEKIVNQTKLGGKTLFDLLQGMVSDKDLQNAKLFVEQLYNPWVVEELIQDLNPLRKLRVQQTLDNTVLVKYLDFNFLRVTQADSEEIDKVFVSVVDVTESVKFQETLEKAHRQHNQELEMIGVILSVSQEQLMAFLTHTEQRVARMNDILKTRSAVDTSKLQEKAKQLYREIHSLKGDASALHLHAFVAVAHKQEEQLQVLLGLPKLSGHDFLPFTVGLNELLELNRFILELLEKLRAVGSQMVQVAHVPNTAQWQQYFVQYANDIAQRNGKYVTVVCEGFDELANHQAFNTYKDIAIQLLKNAIVHGIESPQERTAHHKPEMGQVQLSLTPQEDGICLSICDDGKGIDIEAIRQKAVSLGYVDVNQAQSLSKETLYKYMFQSGFSTSATTTEDAGRGVGMDIVKQFIASANGSLTIDSQPQQFTKIKIFFHDTI